MVPLDEVAGQIEGHKSQNCMNMSQTHGMWHLSNKLNQMWLSFRQKLCQQPQILVQHTCP